MTSETLLMLDPRLHLLAIVVYAIATMANTYGYVMDRTRAIRVATYLAWAGLALHASAIAVRWIGSGHGPYVSRYEVLSANAFVAMLLFLVLQLRYERIRPLSLVVYPVSFLLMAVGLYTGTEVQQLPPTFSGIWLVLHVSFYFLAFATALIAVSSAVLLLVRQQRGDSVSDRIPDVDVLDRWAYRFGGLAFAFWGIGMLTGAIWAYYAWGRFWAWDPIETWSLITWIVFGIYLHLRRFYGWKGARAAWLIIGCFLLAVGTLFFTSLIETSLHAVYFR